MAFGAGKNTKVYVNGYDLTTFFNNAQANESQALFDTTTFGATHRAFINGLTNGTISLAGFFDGSANANDQILRAALGAAADGMCLLFYAGDAIGARGRAASTIETAYAITDPIDGVVGVSAALQSDGGLDAAVSLHALGAETATANGASVDNGASSANGGAGYVLATAFTGTSVVIKVQHSVDNSAWADLITFTAIAAANAYERKTVSGTVNRYLRAQHASGTFSSVTDVVAFGRR